MQSTLAITDGENLAPPVRYSKDSSMIEIGASPYLGKGYSHVVLRTLILSHNGVISSHIRPKRVDYSALTCTRPV